LPAIGPHDLRFRLRDAATGGTQLGPTLCVDNLSVVAGRFTVTLDFGAQFTGQQRFLELEVRADTGLGCGDGSGFSLLTPRQQLTAAPDAQFAMYAANAGTAVNAANAVNAVSATNATNAGNAATAATATNALQLGGQAAAFYRNASNLNTGTVPGAMLGGTYSGALIFSNATNAISGTFTGNGAGLTSLNASSLTSGSIADARLPGNVALLDRAQTFTDLVSYSASPVFNAGGVPFWVASTSRVPNLNADMLDGFEASAFLRSIPVPLSLSGASSTHIVRGENTSAADFSSGVYGSSTATTGITLGGQFESSSSSGSGVFGSTTASGGANYGGQFWNASPDGAGVFGWNSASTGNAYAGKFQNRSTTGRAVFGDATAASGVTFGARFESASTAGRGVLGKAYATTGVTYGVWGQSDSSSGSAYGVWAQGRMGASGTKTFRIDHPEDPENKYLLHYSTESPQALNAYSGTVTLDQTGEAIVELPGYFSRINKDPRYTLTAVGAPMPMLHIAEKIDAGIMAEGERAMPGQVVPVSHFRIAGGVPGGEVSWEVKAVRNDLWVRRHLAPIEVEKEGIEKGTYLHPEFYGKPLESGLEHDAMGEPVERAAQRPSAL
jgi:hypothetical protein